MKTLQKWTSVFFAVIMCFAMFAFTACGGNKESGKTYTAYEFTLVYENGDPATDVSVQLCTINDDGSLGMCYAPVKADANGKVTYKPAGFPGADVYEIHLLGADMLPKEFEGATKTTTKYEAFTLTIKG